MSGSIWRQLGIDRTADVATIRRAYAERLKAIDHEGDAEGFQALRRARDRALQEARQMARARQDGDPPAGLAEDAEARLGALFDGGHGGVVFADEAMGAAHDSGEAPHPAATPAPPEPSALQHAFGTLVQILFPDGEHSSDGLAPEEYAQAASALEQIIAAARDGTLAEHQQIDHELAELLAQGWPRSSALVEQAEDAFGWLGELGQLGERPALMFLNARLRGMRFEHNVTNPDHRLHKAWNLLAAPGTPGFADRFKASLGERKALIGGIRNNFPEVEARLNPDRVAAAMDEGDKGSRGPGIWVWILIVFGGSHLLLGFVDGKDEPALPPPVMTAPVLDEATVLAELYGQDAGEVGEALAAHPDIAAGIDSLVESSRGVGDDGAYLLSQGVGQLRASIFRAADTADFDQLVQLRRLNRDLLFHADQVPGGCEQFRKTLRLPEDMPLPEGTRQNERALAWDMALDGRFTPTHSSEEISTAQVPGWVIESMMQQAGLTEDEVRAGLGNRDRGCGFDIALLDAILSRPGDVPTDLLRLTF